MKIKFPYFILFFCCSCSVITKTSKLQTGRVLMYGTQYPLAVNVDIYQKEKTIISAKSNNEGYFQFPYNNKYRNGLTFVVYKSRSDDTSKLTIYGKILTICKNDTINVEIINLKDTIILEPTKCSWLTVEP